MADNQQNKPLDTTQSKPSTIDDLVKELSKNNNPNQSIFSPVTESGKESQGPSTAMPSRPPLSPSATASQELNTSRYPTYPTSDGAGPPPNLPGVKIESKLPVPPVSSALSFKSSASPLASGSKPLTSSPQPSSQPQPFSPSKSVISPLASEPLKSSPAQEYKSSIRTMSEDIASIKSGQKPSGVDIPRKITPDARPPMPGVQKPAVTSPPGGSMPSSTGLGRAEKTSLLPTSPAPKEQEMPKPTVMQPSIVVPREKEGFIGLKFLNPTLYMLIAGVLVVGGFMYWFFILRVSEPEIVVSPTPSPTVTATPLVKSLSEIFGGSPVNFEFSLSKNVGDDFKTFVNTLSVKRKEFSKIGLVEDREGTLVPISFLDMFDLALTVYPTDLRSNVMDLIALVYGQSEGFSAAGSVNLSISDMNRISFVARIKDKVAVETMMEDWEFTVANDLAVFLLIADTAKEAAANFLDNTYRGVSIKYKNFPFPDVTIDYSIVDSGGQSYLVISGSREAMYATIDTLLAQ